MLMLNHVLYSKIFASTRFVVQRFHMSHDHVQSPLMLLLQFADYIYCCR